MCLIAVKKRNVPLSSEFFKSLVRSYQLRNKDGSGFAIKKLDGRIYISKGYFTIRDLINAIKSHNVQKQDELMVHLRKVSAGKKNIDNCHPYVCGKTEEEILTEEGYVNYPVLSHNGTITKYVNHNSYYSDTYNFVKQKVSKVGYARALSYFNRHEPIMVNNLINHSRLAIMFPGNEVISLIGNWEYDTKTKIYYSNTSYLGDKCTTHGKFAKSYNYAYEC